MAARKQTGKDAKGAQVPQASAPRMRPFVIMRGNMDNTADARKFNDIMVVAQFLSLVRGADVHVGKWSIVVTVVDEEGDLGYYAMSKVPAAVRADKSIS